MLSALVIWLITPQLYEFSWQHRKGWTLPLHQCSQNVDVNGSHHRRFERIVSSSFNQLMAVERAISHELVGSMVGAIYVHVLRTLPCTGATEESVESETCYVQCDLSKQDFRSRTLWSHSCLNNFYVNLHLLYCFLHNNKYLCDLNLDFINEH